MTEEQQPQQQMSEEQVKELQEKIKNMSPEELKEFQKKQCIFCQIISGKVQSKKIYEDESVLAILDINTGNPGHILVMPREHYSIMPQIPEDEVEHIFLVSKMLSNVSLRALEVQGSNIIVANGVAAGQRAQHFMIHLIPRKENDNLGFEVPQKNIDEKELQETADLLANSLGGKAEKIGTGMPQKQVVEAEFEEKAIVKAIEKNPKLTEKKSIPKKKIIQKKSKPVKEKTIQKKEDVQRDEANLDDIARILGAGK